VIFKPEVNLALQPDMAKALPLIELAHHDMDLDRGAVITSANDGTHMVGSLHYAGLAVDIRTRDLAPATIAQLAAKLRAHLNGQENTNRPYQVVLETDHVHVEYQPL